MALILTPNTFTPTAVSHLGSATHYSNYGVGGLKTFDYSASNYDENQYGIDSIAPSRRSTGSIVYIGGSTNKYYMDLGLTNGYAVIPALTTGSPTFPGLTSSAGILVDGGHISVSTPNGTMSAPQITASTGFYSPGTSQLGTLKLTTDLAVSYGGTGKSTFTPNGVLYGNGTSGLLVTAQGAANSVLIANNGAP